MVLTDTHTHLYASQFCDDRDAIISEAINNGIERLFLPNIDEESVGGMLKLSNKYPNQCYPMIGLHPCSVKENWREVLASFEAIFNKYKFYAIGEIGIDLYWDKTYIQQQKEAFAYQIEWAKREKLPIVIHARDSFDEIFEIVDQLNSEDLTGIFHCFTGTKEQANHILQYGGFKLGIGGVLTFKNSGLDQVVSEIPLEHLVLETDAPYLAPHPYRGKRNESSYLKIIAHKLADIQGISIEKVAEVTTQNSKQIFGV